MFAHLLAFFRWGVFVRLLRLCFWLIFLLRFLFLGDAICSFVRYVVFASFAMLATVQCVALFFIWCLRGVLFWWPRGVFFYYYVCVYFDLFWVFWSLYVFWFAVSLYIVGLQFMRRHVFLLPCVLWLIWWLCVYVLGVLWLSCLAFYVDCLSMFYCCVYSV